MKVYCDEEDCKYNESGSCCTLDELELNFGRCVCFVESEKEGEKDED